jgi:hypothetical protein
MKRILIMIVLVCAVLFPALVFYADYALATPLTTRVPAYATLDTLTNAAGAVDTDLSAAAGYNTAVPSGAKDLPQEPGADDFSYANLVSMIMHATGAADGDTLTQKLYGISRDGPPQLIASIVWTIGTARADGSTATYLWADTATVTSSHIKTLVVADGGGSNRVCSVTFDCTGYRYLHSLITAQTGDPTLITVLYRHF